MLAWALGLLVAVADEPTFAVNAVLVPTFPAASDVSPAEAERIRGLIVSALEGRHMVVGIDEVPPFADYPASIYMQACPQGRFIGCGLVVGRRAAVDWVLVGEVKRNEQGLVLEVAYVDVARSEIGFQTETLFEGTADADVAGGIARALDAVVAGLFVPLDIRADEMAAAELLAQEAESEQESVEAEASELEVADRELGEVERSEVSDVDDRVTRADLARYESSDVEPPWVRLRLTSRQWMRWKNSDASLKDYRARIRGRLGEIVLGTGGVIGKGPWTQAWEGWYGLDEADLTVVERATSLEQKSGLERTWQVELSGGILPWMQVTAFGGTKVTDWQWRVQQVVENDDEPVDEPERKVVAGPYLGGRVDFLPLPAAPARPTFGLGAYGWWGIRQERVVDVPEVLPLLERQKLVMLQLSPGFEVQLGKVLLLWGRMNVDLPVGGRRIQEDATPDPLIIGARPTPTLSDDGIGLAGSLGLSARIRIPLRSPGRSDGR